jgi:hypothetical protein
LGEGGHGRVYKKYIIKYRMTKKKCHLVDDDMKIGMNSNKKKKTIGDVLTWFCK